MMLSEKFSSAIQLIDQANQADPNQEISEGKTYSKEILYSQRMMDCLLGFAPEASEALQLAVKAQHICRWEIARDSYSMDREGYHAWRNELKKFHAKKTSAILLQVGYDEDTIDLVSDLLQKKQLKKNKDTQTLEDVICLVFLQYYMENFAKNYSEEKIISILQKTWKKMSEQGQQKALQLKLPPSIIPIVKKALS